MFSSSYLSWRDIFVALLGILPRDAIFSGSLDLDEEKAQIVQQYFVQIWLKARKTIRFQKLRPFKLSFTDADHRATHLSTRNPTTRVRHLASSRKTSRRLEYDITFKTVLGLHR